jgi:hypothetical protein
MKTYTALSACSALMLCTAAHAQVALLSNSSINPSTPALALALQTGNNTPAPSGSVWSELANLGTTSANSLGGVACHVDSTDPSGGLRVSDDFVVPAGTTWSLTRLDVFAYQVSSTFSIASATLRIWSGPPGEVGSTVLFGDATTNRLANVQPTTTQRVFNTLVGPAITAPDVSRRVHQVSLDANVALTGGTYWLDWQVQPSTQDAPVFAVPATIAGVRTQAAWNARQLADGVWSGVLDTGKPDIALDSAQDLAFILTGTSATCDSIDFNGDGLFPDDADLLDFLVVLAGGACSTGTCSDIDFNNDELFPDDGDLVAFLRVLAGGPC